MQLLCTMIYVMGMHCVLRGGVEHINFRCPGCNFQCKIERDTRGVKMFVYREDPLQKTNQGGLLSKGTSKVVYIYGASNRACCPIELNIAG